MTDYKLHVRLGDAEFNAEGPEVVVREQFGLFLEAAKALDFGKDANGAGPKAESTPPKPEAATAEETSHDALLHRVFVVKGDVISLAALPNSETRDGDALLLLLYGFQALKGIHTVPAGLLIEATRVSGVQAARLDRLRDPALVMKAGVKRGSRYSLNNLGVAKAKELLATIFN